MQVQRNLSGNYYTESLMTSSLIRDDKALTSLAKISCTRKKNWFTVYFLNRGFKTHTFLCGSPSSLPVILKASRHKTIYNNRLCWGSVKSIQFHSFTSILTKTIKMLLRYNMYYISTRTWTRRANLSGVEEGRNKLLPFSYIEQNIISLGKIFRLEGHRILRSSRNIFTLVLAKD